MPHPPDLGEPHMRHLDRSDLGLADRLGDAESSARTARYASAESSHPSRYGDSRKDSTRLEHVGPEERAFNSLTERIIVAVEGIPVEATLEKQVLCTGNWCLAVNPHPAEHIVT